MEPPRGGRVYRSERRVRLGDVDESGLIRLDAAARYLQDVASDDVREAGVGPDVVWIVRRTILEVDGVRPRLDEVVSLSTWCSGTGAAWAERRTSLAGPSGAVEAACLWVCCDRATRRPAPLPEGFMSVYGEAAAGRQVRPRLQLSRLSTDALAKGRRWPLRRSDLDVLGHVNNAIAWSALEEEAARVAGQSVTHAEMEYREPLALSDEVRLASALEGHRLWIWLVALGEGASASVVARAELSA